MKSVKLSLTFLLIVGSYMAIAQKQTNQLENTSDLTMPVKSNLLDSKSALKTLKFPDTQSNFNSSNLISSTGVSLTQPDWNIQSILKEGDLQRQPVNRPGVTTMLQGGFDASNLGSQTFRTYKLGNTTLRHINSFDFSGNLNQTTLQIEL